MWIRTPDNHWMPCNEGLIEYKAGDTPDYEDQVVDDKGEVIQCTFDFQCNPDGVARIPHWKTCRYAKDFRKK